jgi:hypothetical protein
MPVLAQISTFGTEYVQDLSQSDSVRPGGQEPRDAPSWSQPGSFLVRRKTQAIWTYVTYWNNEVMLDRAREFENLSDGRFFRDDDDCPWAIVEF